jgi:antitoxin MazE
MRTALRRLGNSNAVIIPELWLKQVGIEAGDDVHLSLDGHRIVVTPINKSVRKGWADCAKNIANSGDDGLIWPDF